MLAGPRDQLRTAGDFLGLAGAAIDPVRGARQGSRRTDDSPRDCARCCVRSSRWSSRFAAQRTFKAIRRRLANEIAYPPLSADLRAPACRLLRRRCRTARTLCPPRPVRMARQPAPGLRLSSRFRHTSAICIRQYSIFTGGLIIKTCEGRCKIAFTVDFDARREFNTMAQHAAAADAGRSPSGEGRGALDRRGAKMSHHIDDPRGLRPVADPAFGIGATLEVATRLLAGNVRALWPRGMKFSEFIVHLRLRLAGTVARRAQQSPAAGRGPGVGGVGALPGIDRPPWPRHRRAGTGLVRFFRAGPHVGSSRFAP